MKNKGFTLVELLAVIVILAVIMVIATQQVNKAIKKSRGNAFYETVQSIRKAAQTVCAMDNKLTVASLKDNVDYSEDDIIIRRSGIFVVVEVKENGKYDNNIGPVVDGPSLNNPTSKGPFQANDSSYEPGVTPVTVITFKAECPFSG